MTRVPPGDETGTYYIIVAGLPWQCSWQKLKDFARNQQADGSCNEVDHAMVYPDTTNGWVRVKGKAEFLKVLAHLNGGVIENRSLIADGRNETEEAVLCDLGTTKRGYNDSITTDQPTGHLAEYQQCITQGFQAYRPPKSYLEWKSQPQGCNVPLSTMFSPGTLLMPPSPIYESMPQAFTVTQPVDYFTSSNQAGIVYAGNMAPTTPVYVPQRQPVYACFPIVYSTGSISPPSTVSAMPEMPTNNTIIGPVVQTEARKVIIKGLPRDAVQPSLVSLIDELYASSPSSYDHHHKVEIKHIELARHPDGKLKGHAFVIFESHRVASKVVAAIDGHKFQGRVLRATLAKEGVESTETFHQPGCLSDSHPQNFEGSSVACSNLDETQFSLYPPPTSVPIEMLINEHQITRGSGEGSSKSSSMGKERSRESNPEDRGRKTRTKSKEPREPAVVDGSGRRRH